MLSLITPAAVEPLSIAEAKRQVRLDDTDGEPSPAAPTVALASPAAPGSVDNGAHRVGVTFVTADGETEIGPLSDLVTVTDKSVNGQLAVTGIATGGAAVTARRVYLLPVGGTAAKLAATLSNNTATTATLNIADAALGVEAPTTNTTQDPRLVSSIVSARERGEAETGRQFITATWDLWLRCFPCDFIDVPRPPLLTVTGITYTDTAGAVQTLAADQYRVIAPAGPRCARGRVEPAYGITWPLTRDQHDAVKVRFTAGYGATGASVPGQLRRAMLLDLGTAYAASGDTVTNATVSPMPLQAKTIYRAYRTYPLQRAA